MNTRLKHSILTALACVPLAAVSADRADSTSGHDSHASVSPTSPLVRKVREAISKFTKEDFDAYKHLDTSVITPCVSGPDYGAMGVHFVDSTLLDALLDPKRPEALIYEPQADGRSRLVGVEFIVPKPAWDAAHPPAQAARGEPAGLPTPDLEGHLLHLVTAPNRFGLPDFYEIHVWAFRDNPDGTFTDWNREVTCEKQRLPQG